MLINLQKRYVVRRAGLEPFLRNLKRRLRLANRELNICFVDDGEIRRLNSLYRGKDKATDVLSFAWNDGGGRPGREASASLSRRAWGEKANFLGEVVISVETARHNAAAEGHSTLNEIRWLILHGVLHLLGYDHERDTGEMTALELVLREQLSVANGKVGKGKGKSQKAKLQRQNRRREF